MVARTLGTVSRIIISLSRDKEIASRASHGGYSMVMASRGYHKNVRLNQGVFLSCPMSTGGHLVFHDIHAW